MDRPDFNLLLTLDVLLSECSVAKAAKKLRLSPSAMSRALARLRSATGDPLLVRSGRGLVPTPRAAELRAQVGPLVRAGLEVLRPGGDLDLSQLTRSFTVRSSEGFVENYGASLIARVRAAAPKVLLRFVHKADRESDPMRDGSVDLEIGVVRKSTNPDLLMQAVFRDRFVGVVRNGDPLSKGEMTRARYTASGHIGISRQGIDMGPVDVELQSLGKRRNVVVVVSSFSAALALARSSDLLASVPERHTGVLRSGMHTFSLPVPVPDIQVSLLWHPRLDADVANRWLRACVREVCIGSDPAGRFRQGRSSIALR